MDPSTRSAGGSGAVPSLSESDLTALRVLAHAAAAAKAVARDAWEFAVERYSLREAGLDHSALRRLVCEGLILAGEETTSSRHHHRTFRRSANLRLTERTCFILAPRGESILRALGASQEKPGGVIEPPAGVRLGGRQPLARPHWDGERRVLTCSGRVVKQYRVPAPNQEYVLSAFEEEGWPRHLDDPIPGGSGTDAKQRLRETIKSLNHHQAERLLRFWADGNGTGVCWEPV